MLKFDEASHTYTFNGKRVPNVTTILDPLVDYSMVPTHILEAAKDRGDYVHKACEMVCWGTLDEDELDPEFAPYVDAFKLFLLETGFEPVHIEERVYHPVLNYAGTLDLAGTLPPKGKRKNPQWCVMDIKTTAAIMPSVGPQTAAYQEAWNHCHKPKLTHRYVVKLSAKGYELQALTDRGDLNIFLSCLNIVNFLARGK